MKFLFNDESFSFEAPRTTPRSPAERNTSVNIIQGVHLSRMRIMLIALVLAVAGLLLSASQIAPAGATTLHAASDGPKPTIVLEHGAWADASSWTGEIQRLQAN